MQCPTELQFIMKLYVNCCIHLKIFWRLSCEKQQIIYQYIYIERDRQRDRERERKRKRERWAIVMRKIGIFLCNYLFNYAQLEFTWDHRHDMRFSEENLIRNLKKISKSFERSDEIGTCTVVHPKKVFWYPSVLNYKE